MPKVKDKLMDEVYEVYGAREIEYTEHEYEGSWEVRETEFLLHKYGSWGWYNAKYYEPYDL